MVCLLLQNHWICSLTAELVSIGKAMVLKAKIKLVSCNDKVIITETNGPCKIFKSVIDFALFSTDYMLGNQTEYEYEYVYCTIHYS